MTHLAWITGANGFLGRYTARRFARAGWRVVGIGRSAIDDDFTAAWGIARWVAGPFGPELLERVGEIAGDAVPAVVVHALGSGTVGVVAADPPAAFDATVRSTMLLLDHLRRTAPETRILYPSSAAAYGGNDGQALAEDVPVNPVSTYGWHKVMAETLLAEARGLHGMTATAVRFFSLYGPGLRKQVLWDWSRRILTADAGQHLEFSGTGEEIRDFLHVEDAAALLLHLAGCEAASCPAVLNGGTGTGTSLRRLATDLAVALGCRPAIVFDGHVRIGDPPCYRADPSRLAACGFVPSIGLPAGLNDYAAWAKSA